MTPPKYPKRLIEVDLPIKRISAHARREKSIRHGHISTLHIWWARRPLAACRAVICAALWPDPAQDDCPLRFRDRTAERLKMDYWLYVVYNCVLKLEIHLVQDPGRLEWELLVKIEHYHVSAERILSIGNSTQRF
jgi:hypothetical protein